MSKYKNIIFDVGSVLVNWMRINLYTTLLHGDKDKAKWMVDNIVTNSWNDQTDLGSPSKNVSSNSNRLIPSMLLISWHIGIVIRTWMAVRFQESIMS